MEIFDKKLTQEERYEILYMIPPLSSVIGELFLPEDYFVLGYEIGEPSTLLVGNPPDQVFECPYCKSKEYTIHSKHIRKSFKKNDYGSLNIAFLYHKFKCKSCLKIFTEPTSEFNKYKRYSSAIKEQIIYFYTEEGSSLRDISKDLKDLHGIHLSKSTISNILKEDRSKYEEYKKMHEIACEKEKEYEKEEKTNIKKNGLHYNQNDY